MPIARAFVEEIILKFGIPQTVPTDQGSNFMSEVFGNVCKLLKIKNIKCIAYHPQTNGALERIHRVLIEHLRCFILEDQSNWDKWLPYATFVFNTTPPHWVHPARTVVRPETQYTRATRQTLNTHMMTMLRNCNPVCGLVIL